MPIPLRVTDRIDENSLMGMETACSFKMLVNSYHSVWDHKQGDYNLNEQLARKTVRKVFLERLYTVNEEVKVEYYNNALEGLTVLGGC